MVTKAHLSFASDHSLLINFGSDYSEATRLKILRLSLLLSKGSFPGILNFHPAFSSLLISYNPLSVSPSDIESTAIRLLDEMESVVMPPPRQAEIPVCYELGEDLDYVAKFHAIKPSEVIEIHSTGEYVVSFLGFSPGFPYLAGLPERIATPRRATPRLKVAAGSVGIGGRQSGIYPVSTPGGWQIIGRTPMRIFDAERQPPALLEMGSSLRFVPISTSEFHKMSIG